MRRRRVGRKVEAWTPSGHSSQSRSSWRSSLRCSGRSSWRRSGYRGTRGSP